MNKTELLKFQLEMGADESIGHTPVNRLLAAKKPVGSETVIEESRTATKAPTPSATAEPTMPATKKSSTPALSSNVSAAIAKAKELASAAKTLEELRAAVQSFDGLAIKKTATNTVFSDGNRHAPVMFIGEAPGANEDAEGIPFCGISGKLLDTMLGTIGITRAENAYITNTIFWRPPGNRRPTPEELMICRPFVEKHIALLNPKMLVLVGGTATAALLDDSVSVSRLRGKFHSYKTPFAENPYPVGVLFHPSYLLRSPLQKRLAWHDLQILRDRLEQDKVL
ncbi:MAG: uracil-DNA glycosylase [Proteobacteria bacterium]|nr:uracil-DNA glycosylase [Pseudomonadota bacterium]